MVKKIILFLLSAILIWNLTACGEKGKYEKAGRLREEQKYEEAIALYTKLGDYQDADSVRRACYKEYFTFLCEHEEYSKAREVGEEFKQIYHADDMDVEDYIRIYEGVNKILSSDEDAGWALLKKQRPTDVVQVNDIWSDILQPAIEGEEKDKQLKAYKIVKYFSKKLDKVDELRFCDGRDPTLKLRALEVGETFTFGEYDQDYLRTNAVEKYDTVYYPLPGSFKKKPVEWVVLDKDGSKILAITKNCIECVNCGGAYAYNHKGDKMRVSEYLPSNAFNAVCSDNAVFWKDSAVRDYLNNDVYRRIFRENEMKYVVPVTIDQCDTKDKLFLLSYEENEKYKRVANFPASKTEYAVLLEDGDTGYAMSDSELRKVRGNTTWWALRKTANDPAGPYRARGYSENEVYWCTTGNAYSERAYTRFGGPKERGYVRVASWFDFHAE